ncbi:MAG: c-type cytochrome [Alphaproteobacteria bacterium]|nr:c-type cytochrome [Alphaproteobacteria bacterium]
MRKSAILAGLVLAMPFAASAQSVTPTQVMAATCAGCHGSELTGAGGVPSLRGQQKDYLERTLNDFKSGQRPATVMNRLAKGYSPEQIAELAQYLAGLK